MTVSITFNEYLSFLIILHYPSLPFYCHLLLVWVLLTLYVIYFLLYFHLITFPISFPCCFPSNHYLSFLLILSSSCCHLVVTVSVNKLVLVSGVVLSFYRFCYSIDSVWFTCFLVVLLIFLLVLSLHLTPPAYLLSHDVRPLPPMLSSLQCASNFYSYMCCELQCPYTLIYLLFLKVVT